MPITVQHGPDQSRYASIVADSAKKTENYERLKQIAEFMQAVKQQNREYELGKKQNELTGRGQDIQYDLGLKDVGLRGRGYDLQETDQNRDYELGLRSAGQGDKSLELQQAELAQQKELEKQRLFQSNPGLASRYAKDGGLNYQSFMPGHTFGLKF